MAVEQGKGLTSFIGGGGGGGNPPTTGSSSPSSCESYPQLNGASNHISSIWRPQKPLGRPREGRRGPGMSRDVIFQITRLHPAGEPGGRLGRPPAPASGSGGPKNGGSRGADGRPVRRGSGKKRKAIDSPGFADAPQQGVPDAPDGPASARPRSNVAGGGPPRPRFRRFFLTNSYYVRFAIQ